MDVSDPMAARHQRQHPLFLRGRFILQGGEVAFDPGENAGGIVRTALAVDRGRVAADVDEVIVRVPPWPLVFLQAAKIE